MVNGKRSQVHPQDTLTRPLSGRHSSRLLSVVSLLTATSSAADHGSPACFNLENSHALPIYLDPLGDDSLEWLWHPDEAYSTFEAPMQGPIVVRASDPQAEDQHCWKRQPTSLITASFNRISIGGEGGDNFSDYDVNIDDATQVTTEGSHLKWQIKEYMLPPEAAGPWSVKLTADDGSTLLAFTMEVLASCPQRMASLIIAAPIWPGDSLSLIDTPIDHLRHNAQSGYMLYGQNCEALLQAPVTDMVPLSTSKVISEALLLSESATPGGVSVRLDANLLDGGFPSDPVSKLTVLEKHANIFSSVLQAEVKLIDCLEVLKVIDGEASLEEVLPGDDLSDESLVKLVTEVESTILSPGQEKPAITTSEITKNVRFIFVDPARSAMASKCLAKLPPDMELWCSQERLTSRNPESLAIEATPSEVSSLTSPFNVALHETGTIQNLEMCRFQTRKETHEIEVVTDKRQLLSCVFDVEPGTLQATTIQADIGVSPQCNGVYETYIYLVHINPLIDKTETWSDVYGTQRITSMQFQPAPAFYDTEPGYAAQVDHYVYAIDELGIRDIVDMMIVFYNCGPGEVYIKYDKWSGNARDSPCCSFVDSPTSPETQSFQAFTNMKEDIVVSLYAINPESDCFTLDTHHIYFFTKTEFESNEVSQWLQHDTVVGALATELDSYEWQSRNLAWQPVLEVISVGATHWDSNKALELTMKGGVSLDDISTAGMTDGTEEAGIAASIVIAHVFKDKVGYAFSAKMFAFDIKIDYCAYVKVKDDDTNAKIGPLVGSAATNFSYEPTMVGQSVTFFDNFVLTYDLEYADQFGYEFDTSIEFTWTKGSTIANWPCQASEIKSKIADYGTHTYEIITVPAKDVFSSSTDYDQTLTINDVPSDQADSKLQSLTFVLQSYGRTIYSTYIDIMVGPSTPELKVLDTYAEAASADGVIIKVAKELQVSLQLSPDFFFEPKNNNYYGSFLVDEIDRVSYTDSWVPSFTSSQDLTLEPISLEDQRIIDFSTYPSSFETNFLLNGSSQLTTVTFTGTLERTETWQFGNESVVAIRSFVFEYYNIFSAEYIELAVEPIGAIPEFNVPMDIHGGPAPVEQIGDYYTIDYRFIKFAPPFTPDPWDVSYTVYYHYYAEGDSIIDDPNFDTGIIDPVSYQCQPWTLELQGQTIETSFYVKNSIDEDIKTLVHALCINAPCENRIALEQDYFDQPDQQEEKLETMYPLVHYPAVQQELPVIDTYCSFTHVQELLSATVALANGGPIKVTQEALSLEYGVTLTENFLEMQTDKVELYGARIELSFKNTLVEEATFFNTTLFSFEYTKPPCYVTSEDIQSVAGGLSFNLHAKMMETTDQFQITAYNETIVMAFNQTEEFWCGAIQTELEANDIYLEFDENQNLLILDPRADSPIGSFTGGIIRYFYNEHPEKQIEVPIVVTIEGCEDKRIQFTQDSVTEDIVIGRPDPVTVSAPSLEALAKCADEVEASYTLMPLSVPADASGLDQFIVYDATNHTFVIQPQKDFGMLGKAVSGTFKGSPDSLNQSFTVTVSVHYVTIGPEFEEQSTEEQEKNPKFTCSTNDINWSMELPPIIAEEELSPVIELVQDTEISQMFVYDAESRTVTIAPRYQTMVVNGDLCPEDDYFELDFLITTQLIGESTQTFKFGVQPSNTGTNRTSFKGVSLDQAILKSKGKTFKQPTISISSISATGELIISFSDPFLIPDDLKKFKAKDFIIEGRARTNLELIVEAVEGQLEDDLKFDWQILSFEEKKLTLQLNFEKPYMVSQASEFNAVHVNVWDPSLFLRKDDLEPIPPLTQLSKKLPKIVDKETAETVTEAATTISISGKTAVGIIFFLGFFFNMGMSRMLGQVQNLNIITHFMMMQLSYPATMSLFFSKIFEFVTFDLIPTDLFFPYIFVDLEADPFNEDADKIGYYSRYILHNLGSITIFIIGQIVSQLLFLLLARCLPEGRVLNFVRRKQENFRWAGFVDFFSDIYITLSFVVCINLSKMEIKDYITGLNNVYCSIMCLAILGVPPLIYLGLYRGWRQLPFNAEVSDLEKDDEEEKKQENQLPAAPNQQEDNNLENQLESIGDEANSIIGTNNNQNESQNILLAANSPINGKIMLTKKTTNHLAIEEEEKIAVPPTAQPPWINNTVGNIPIPFSNRHALWKERREASLPKVPFGGQEEEKKAYSTIKRLTQIDTTKDNISVPYNSQLTLQPTSQLKQQAQFMEGGELTKQERVKEKQKRQLEKVTLLKKEIQISHVRQVAARFGSLAQSLKIGSQSLSQRKANVFILLSHYRLLALACIITGLYELPTLQILLTILVCFGWTLTFVIIWPFESRAQNISVLINEMVTMLTLYLLVGLTGEFIGELERERLGLILICLTAANFVINVLIVLVQNRRSVALWCTRKMNERKAHKLQKEKLANQQAFVCPDDMHREPPSQQIRNLGGDNEDRAKLEADLEVPAKGTRTKKKRRRFKRKRKSTRGKASQMKDVTADEVGKDITVVDYDENDFNNNSMEIVQQDDEYDDGEEDEEMSRESLEKFIERLEEDFEGELKFCEKRFDKKNALLACPSKKFKKLKKAKKEQLWRELDFLRLKMMTLDKRLQDFQKVKNMSKPENDYMMPTERDRALVQFCEKYEIEQHIFLVWIVTHSRYHMPEEERQTQAVREPRANPMQVHMIRTDQ